MFDHLGMALKRHLSKAKELAPKEGHGEPVFGDNGGDPDGDERADQAPNLQHSGPHPDGANLPPNAHASPEDQASLKHMDHIQALLGHGGPLARHAYASAEGDKDKEKMASIEKHKKGKGY